MRYEVFYTPKAQKDLDSIWYYIAIIHASPQSARKLLNKITTAIDQLSDIGGGYKLYPHEPWHSQGIHFFSVRRYSIFYRLRPSCQRVEVLRIVAGSRNLDVIEIH